jgi:hypothetical protein
MDRPKPGSNTSAAADLEDARTSSRRLRGDADAPPAQAGYVSFGPRALPPAPGRAAVTAPGPQARPSLPLTTRREPLKAPVTGFGPVLWDKLLDACRAASLAEAAFLMDAQGLLVSARGSRAQTEPEAVGARLMRAFEQADRIDGERAALSLSLETSHFTLHGLRLVQPDGTFLTLGLIVPGGLTAERQARVLALLAAATD